MKSIIVMVVLTVIVGIFGITYVKYHNLGVQSEARLEMAWDDSRATLSNTTSIVMETASVATAYQKGLESVIEATFNGRYGDNGSQAVFQWIQEQNPNLDPSLFTKVQQVIESGRNDFLRTQRIMIDIRENYIAQQNYFWSGLWLGIAGFPKTDMSKYKTVVLGTVATQFETGEAQLMTPFGQ